jgi:Chaperone of endosialidase
MDDVGGFVPKINLIIERRKKMKKILVVLLAIIAISGFMAVSAFSEDKLVVKDSTGTNTVFAVQDGTSVPNRILVVSGGVPIMQNAGTAGFDFKNTGSTFGASISVGTAGNPNLYGNWLAATNAKDDVTKVTWGLRLDIGGDRFRVVRVPVGGGSSDVFDVNGNGSLSSVTGATLTVGGVWTDNSSRNHKENISALSTEEAINTLAGLNPVKYNYKVDKDERHVGFIAEDVPELVATKDRKTLSALDIVAVLTKVVQEQKETVEKQQKTLAEQQETIARISEKLERLERAGQRYTLKGTLASKVD